MQVLMTKNKVDQLLSKLENFNETTHEDEIEELSSLASFIMDLGAGVSPILKNLLDKKQEVDSELLNYLIKNVQVEKMKLVYSSAILRYTAYYKEELLDWNVLLDKVEKQCIKRNINEEEVLIGLKD